MVRTRFAPSPTGTMHVGNLRTALYAYLFAKTNGGKFVLRVEDTDKEREVMGAVDKIYSTLKLAGIEFDESPSVGGAFGPYMQSERLSIYGDYAKKLISLGGAYYCFCDKERLDTLNNENGIRKYDKRCLALSTKEVQEKLKKGAPYVIRQNMPTAGESSYIDLVYGEITVPAKELEDNVLLKSDGYPTYNFANVIDDYLMQITHVMRGSEYLSSTPKYNLIYKAFGWEEPKYAHLPAIMKDKTRKLSKRHGDANFEDFYEKGFLPEAIINYIALLGWSPKNHQEKLTLKELVSLFSIDGINKSGAIFDEEKLKWLNGLYIKEMEFKNFVNFCKPYLKKAGVLDKFDTNKLCALLQTRINFGEEIIEKVAFLNSFENYNLNLFANQKMKTDKELAKVNLTFALEELKALPCFDKENINNAIAAASEKAGIKKGQMMYMLRVSLTGAETSPGGASEMAEMLGKEETLKRLSYSINYLLQN